MASALILFSLQVHAMEVDQEPEPKSIDEIPEYCIKLVEKLLQKRTQHWCYSTYDKNVYFGKTYVTEHCNAAHKHLLLQNKAIGQICSVLSSENKSFSIQVLESPYVSDEQELVLCWDWKHEPSPKRPLDPNNLGSLQKLYAQRIRGLQFGWRQEEVLNINLRDLYGDISPQDYLLFSKKQSFEQEGPLIDSLASKFNISRVTKSAINLGDVERTYLAIEKDSLEQVKSIFKFTTNKECADLLAKDLNIFFPHSQNNLPHMPLEDIQKIANKCWGCDD